MTLVVVGLLVWLWRKYVDRRSLNTSSTTLTDISAPVVTPNNSPQPTDEPSTQELTVPPPPISSDTTTVEPQSDDNLTPTEIEFLNTQFHNNKCLAFDAAQLELALSTRERAADLFHLKDLAHRTPEDLGQFIKASRQRFPFFKEYCKGRRTATQFATSLQAWY